MTPEEEARALELADRIDDVEDLRVEGVWVIEDCEGTYDGLDHADWRAAWHDAWSILRRDRAELARLRCATLREGDRLEREARERWRQGHPWAAHLGEMSHALRDLVGADAPCSHELEIAAEREGRAKDAAAARAVITDKVNEAPELYGHLLHLLDAVSADALRRGIAQGRVDLEALLPEAQDRDRATKSTIDLLNALRAVVLRLAPTVGAQALLDVAESVGLTLADVIGQEPALWPTTGGLWTNRVVVPPGPTVVLQSDGEGYNYDEPDPV